MPFKGDIITAAHQRQVLQVIDELTGSAQRAVASYSDAQLAEYAAQPFELIPQSAQTVARHSQWMMDNSIWRDDHNCLYRAVQGALKLNADAGLADSPARSAYAAGIAVLYRQGSDGWPFHCATAVQVEGEKQLQLIDYLGTFRGVSRPLREWHVKYGASHPVKILRPFNGSGATLRSGEVLPAHLNVSGFEGMRNALRATWEKPSVWGVEVAQS